ncbi:tetratricopeptide repeat protein [Streptomyces sp. NPDC002888]|uniref:tetratricopeptide repeat protein n=1 Tax=Streptomyces sp. NPDC002888 TaxID=3364668 RepID=UPI0036C9F18D
MADEPSTHNEISSAITGNVVQARTIHQVVLREQTGEALPVPRQLPGAPRDFVGRADYVVTLDSLLATAPENAATTCVVEGTAGAGKTTLALWWAHRVQRRFPGGTLFVNLRGFDREQPLAPSLALTSFLQAFGVLEERIPIGLDAQAGMLRSVLAGRRVLMVLDNAGSAEQVRPLLPGSEGCFVLVTSRRSLTGLAVTDAARSVPLDLFTPHEAEQLIRDVVGEDRVGGEPEAVAHLIDRCARLPLALRVAASRLAARRRRSIAELVDEMGRDRAQLLALSSASDDRSAVSTVFDWSYTQLPEELTRLFRRLGLHPTPEFGLHAAASFGGLDMTGAYRQVEELVDANLVEPVGHRRYRLHDLLHAYAARRAETDEPADGRAAALCDGLTWYARAALAADRLLFPGHPSLTVEVGHPGSELPVADRSQAWAWLDTERITLLAALKLAVDRDLHKVVVAIAGSMRYLAFQPRALWPIRLDAESLGLLAARADHDSGAEMTFLRRRADTYQMLGRWEESDADLEEHAARAAESGDRLLLGMALSGLGRSRKLQNRLHEAWDHYLRALPLVRGSEHVEAVVECNLSQIAVGLGRYHEALEHARRELELRRGSGDVAGEGYALHDMAVAYQALGDDRSAVEFAERAIVLLRAAVATERYLAHALETAALSHARTGARASASRCLREAATILAELGDPRADAVRERAGTDVSPGSGTDDGAPHAPGPHDTHHGLGAAGTGTETSSSVSRLRPN